MQYSSSPNESPKDQTERTQSFDSGKIQSILNAQTNIASFRIQETQIIKSGLSGPYMEGRVM